jgi:hypothetical protein
MSNGYIDLDNFSHLPQAEAGKGDFKSKLWRESYYFNMTDPRSGFTIITTIGILPNKNLNTGLLLIIKNNKIQFLKPLIERKRVRFNDYSFSIKGLNYSIEGTDWLLKYKSKTCTMNIHFRPLNKIFSYINDESDIIFKSIGTQHYEQFGVFNGELDINNTKTIIGPAFGHRDHSWGIRDWSSVDFYKLFCCVFKKDLAFNLWQGNISNRPFIKGYVFDGESNVKIAESNIIDRYKGRTKCPKSSVIRIKDEKGRRFEIGCTTKFSLQAPPRGSIVYECVGEMRCSGKKGYGVQEYLYHEPNKLYRTFVFIKLLRFI